MGKVLFLSNVFLFPSVYMPKCFVLNLALLFPVLFCDV